MATVRHEIALLVELGKCRSHTGIIHTPVFTLLSSVCLIWIRWHKPVGENTAHDELVECSNMGRCDRFSGQCSCRPGFEV
jgi:hypothetical protein